MATTKATLLGHRSATSFSDLTLSGDLTVNGTTTTLDTAVQNVDKLEIGASSTDYGAKINQASTGNILQLQDGGTDVMVVADGGSTTFSLEDGVTNAVTTVATLRHTSSGTTANGFGTGLRFEGEQPNGGTNIPMASINTVWSNGSAEESDLRFQTGDGGVLSDVMTLTKDGNVGIGTSDPDGLLQVKSSGQTDFYITAGDTSEANLLFGDSTLATDAGIRYNNNGQYMRFITNNAERMRIDSSGLHVGRTGTGWAGGGSIRIDGSLESVISGGPALRAGRGSTTGVIIEFKYNNSIIGSVSTNGPSNTAFNTSSDYRLKENIYPLTDALERLNQLKPSRFNFIADPDKTMDGFLAHEVSDYVPEAVTGEKDQVDEDGEIEPQGIDQSKLVPLIVASIQELSEKVTTLENATN